MGNYFVTSMEIVISAALKDKILEEARADQYGSNPRKYKDVQEQSSV